MENIQQFMARREEVLDVFGKYDKMGEQVAIYVPSTVNATEQVDSEEMVGYVISELTRMFGGTTTTKGRGSWLSDEHGVIVENVTIVRANTDMLKPAQAEKVAELAMFVKSEMSQESVSIEYNGTLMFV